MRHHALASVMLLAVSTSGFAQCAASGLSLSYQGERLGDPFAIKLIGTPGAPGLLGVDLASGPVVTSVGTVCLGLTPALQLLPFTVAPTGQATFAGVLPASSAFIGLSPFLQAGAIDPSQPGGIGLSNGANPTLRSPRIYFYDRGSEVSGIPGAWCAYDALTDAVTTQAYTLPYAIRDAIVVPSLGWVAFLVANQSLYAAIHCFDANTGVPTLTIPLAAGAAPHKLGVSGDTLYVLRAGPAGIDSYSLPSAIPGFSTTLSIFGAPQDVVIPPGSSTAYLLKGGAYIYRVDLATGAQLPTIPLFNLNPPNEWLLVGHMIYLKWTFHTFLFGGGPGLQALDTTTNLTLYPTPLAMPFTGTGQKFRYGPGQFGNALFMQVTNPGGMLLAQIDPATLTPFNLLGPFGGPSEMVASAGGTEWLLTCDWPVGPFNPCSPMLRALHVPSMAITTNLSLPVTPQLLFSLPSATLRKAYFVYGGNQLVAFNTDPLHFTFNPVTLPVSSGQLRFLID
jgi:hypothetical protein